MTRYELEKNQIEKVTTPLIELIDKSYNIILNHRNRTLFVETGDSERPYLEIYIVAHTPTSGEKNIQEMKKEIEQKQEMRKQWEEAKKRIEEKRKGH